MNHWIGLTSLFFIAGCSTYKTIDPKDDKVAIKPHNTETYCKSIPRVYSGVAYNFCLLYGEPANHTPTYSSLNGVPFGVIDAAFSSVADTLVLPYTVSKQLTKGNIKVEK